MAANLSCPACKLLCRSAAFADSLHFLPPPGLLPNPSPRRERSAHSLTNCSQRFNTFAACLTFRPVAFIVDATFALYDMSQELGAIATATNHTMVWFCGLPLLPSNHHFLLVELRSLSVLRYMRFMSLYNVAKYQIIYNITYGPHV